MDFTTSGNDDVTWASSGGPMTIKHAIIYRERRWYERWFSWLWRPWRSSNVIAVMDLTLTADPDKLFPEHDFRFD